MSVFVQIVEGAIGDEGSRLGEPCHQRSRLGEPCHQGSRLGEPCHQEPCHQESHQAFAGAGAVVEFRGVVRPAESGEAIEALEYEAYLPMAQRELERLARAAVRRHGLIGVRIWHSRGRVGAGECSLRILVGAERRKAAIAAVDELVDELKREVPIWKRACDAAGVRE